MSLSRSSKRHLPLHAFSAAILTGAIGFAAPAYAQLPAVQTQNDVNYVVGGIGSDESEAIKAAMKDYSLALIFARPQEGGAAYLSDVQVVIEDEAGKPILNVKPDGPYLLAKVPPGRYKVTANAGGNVQTKTLSVQAGQTTQQRFDWK